MVVPFMLMTSPIPAVGAPLHMLGVGSDPKSVALKQSSPWALKNENKDKDNTSIKYFILVRF
jgi:hypothetical protein